MDCRLLAPLSIEFSRQANWSGLPYTDAYLYIDLQIQRHTDMYMHIKDLISGTLL